MQTKIDSLPPGYSEDDDFGEGFNLYSVKLQREDHVKNNKKEIAAAEIALKETEVALKLKG